MSRKIYIVIKEYDEQLAKRQPWYSIKKLKEDIEKNDCNVEIVNKIEDIAYEFEGNVIKIFSFKDLFQNKKHKFKLIYLMTFPIYNWKKFFTFDFKTTIENWKGLDRVFLMSFIPELLLKKTLMKADNVLVISDRSESYLSKYVKTLKYIPFINNNWGDEKLTHRKNKNKIIGYFGPPYLTRSFDQVIDFFQWSNQNNYQFDKKLITRIERDELKDMEKKYISKIDDSRLKVISGFLDRESLAKELMELDVLILPFKIVMSELPVVVLEALELNIPVVTTYDSGIASLAKDMKNVLIIERFSRKYYSDVIDFIEKTSMDDFQKILNRINKVNSFAMEELCQK